MTSCKKTVKIFSEYIGMEFRVSKCRIVKMEREICGQLTNKKKKKKEIDKAERQNY